MFARSVAAVALLASVVVAQNTTFDPNTISLTMRSQWCQGQENTCGTLCSGDVLSQDNTCDPNTLNFTCLCNSNHSTPGLQYYTTTIPTFECIAIFQQCIAAGENDAAAQALCTSNKNKNCGTMDPANFTAAAATTTSASATATPSATGSTESSASAPAPSSTSSKAAAATMMAAVQNFGPGTIAVGMAAAFGFML